MTTPPSKKELPRYDADLSTGHTDDCLGLSVATYGDLYADIQKTADEIFATLFDLSNEYIASDLEKLIQPIIDKLPKIDAPTYEGLLNLLRPIQQYLLATPTSLTCEEKTAFWTPFAECYARVQAALKERIKPLEERELLTVGMTVMLPVYIFAGTISPSIQMMIRGIDPGKYALYEYPGETIRKRVSDTDFEFSHDYRIYIQNDRAKMTKLLPFLNKPTELPVKIVSTDPCRIEVGIDWEALEAMPKPHR